MKRLKLVTKFFLKNALQEMFGKSKLNPWVSMLLTLILVLLISAPFAVIVGGIYEPLEAMGQQGILLSMLSFLGAAIIFIFGIYTILNVFYFSNDIEQILPLPFKSSEIVFGKFLAALLDMYMYSISTILPFVVYGIVSKAGVVYYIYIVISIIISPILAMILAGIICMIIMRFTSLSKHKDGFRIFAGVLMLVVVVLFNVFTNKSDTSGGDEAIVKLMLQGNNSLMGKFSNIFITNKFAAYGMLYSKEPKGLLFMLAAIVISIAAFAIYYIVGGKLYLNSVVGMSETFSKRGNIFEGKDSKKLIKKNSPVKSLVIKDLKIMIRTPQFFINTIAMIFYMPAILFVAMFSKDNMNDVAELLSSNINNYGYLYLVVFVVSTLAISTGGAAATAVSREGRDFFVSKYIPIAVEDLVKSKIISSLIVNAISSIISIIAMIVIKLPVTAIILASLISISSVVAISFIQLYLDYRSPNVSWDVERDIFKKNYMPLIMLLGVFLIAGVIGLLTFLLQNQIIIFVLLIAVCILIVVSLYPLIKKTAEKTYLQD